MNLLKQIETAYTECQFKSDKLILIYKALVGLLIAIPLLYVCGVITGILFFKNPHAAGKAVINGVF